MFVPGHLPSIHGDVPYSVLCLFQDIYQVSMEIFHIVCCVCSRASTECQWICSIQCVVFVPGHLPSVHGDVPHSVVCLFQGIYRVSAVKSKVERLCQSFETDCDEVDLSEHHPNVIANVLKLYLRQVTTPTILSSLPVSRNSTCLR